MKRFFSEMTKCHRFLLVSGVFAIGVVALAAAVLVLAFGNPQWHRFVYLFQVRVYPGYEEHIPTPPHYTGVWIDWHSDGEGWCESPLVDGKLHGKMTNYRYEYANDHRLSEVPYKNGKAQGKANVWYENGKLKETWIYSDDRLNGIATKWHVSGTKREEAYYLNDLKTGLLRKWDKDGRLTRAAFYLSGKEVTREQYLAARAKDPTLPKPPEKDIGKAHPNPAPSQRKRTAQNDTIAEGNDDRER